MGLDPVLPRGLRFRTTAEVTLQRVNGGWRQGLELAAASPGTEVTIDRLEVPDAQSDNYPADAGKIKPAIRDPRTDSQLS